jgi:hypothetical protein
MGCSNCGREGCRTNSKKCPAVVVYLYCKSKHLDAKTTTGIVNDLRTRGMSDYLPLVEIDSLIDEILQSDVATEFFKEGLAKRKVNDDVIQESIQNVKATHEPPAYMQKAPRHTPIKRVIGVGSGDVANDIIVTNSNDGAMERKIDELTAMITKMNAKLDVQTSELQSHKSEIEELKNNMVIDK